MLVRRNRDCQVVHRTREKKCQDFFFDINKTKLWKMKKKKIYSIWLGIFTIFHLLVEISSDRHFQR